jgi:hypothetical protein
LWGDAFKVLGLFAMNDGVRSGFHMICFEFFV